MTVMKSGAGSESRGYSRGASSPRRVRPKFSPFQGVTMSRTSIILAGILLVLWGCEGGGNPPPSRRISVSLTPTAANVHVNRSVQFTAAVSKTTNTAVTWSISGAGCSGATCGTISDTGLYTAPADVPSPATLTIKTTAAADTSKSASATITILPAIAVTVSPSDLYVGTSTTQQFTATVQNAIDSSVTWSISGSGCTGPECGTISTTGLYTAPSVVPSVPAVTITATSVEDPAMSGSATATIAPFFSVEWTWISGSKSVDQLGIYGTKGTADPANVPGARAKAVSWLDPSGQLWLFGGVGLDSVGPIGEYLNDLWRYDPAANEWTWASGSDISDQSGSYGAKGTADPLNVPGARENAVSWVDSSGRLWLFGGSGYDSLAGNGVLNDLWKYDPASLEWTWVSGGNTINQSGIYGTKGTAAPANVPGARRGAVSWVDSSDNLWLFGGYGYGSAGNYGPLNDLWKYDPAILEWTWVSGSSSANQLGIYGTKGAADPLNVPGARQWAAAWLDPSGQLWLFGGEGYDSAGVFGKLNDLWKYDPATLEWTWVSGSNAGGQAGIYGTKGIADDPLNAPGGRYQAVSWHDASGDLWLFGGVGLDSAGTSGFLNDLWKYDPATLEWIWVSGSILINRPGTYGTKGTAASSNVPGARQKPLVWFDSAGQLWLFGGCGFDSISDYGYLNDLWRGIR
jgi:N-acetylneuraminic acid mutarotase